MTTHNNLRRLLIHNLELQWGEDLGALTVGAARRLKLEPSHIQHLELVRKSLDSRHKPRFICSVIVGVEHSASLQLSADITDAPDPALLSPQHYAPKRHERVVVIGAGPAGLFCAHRLAASGMRPILLDRGQPVETRAKDVSSLMHSGTLLPDSNICFGEGGAGTWSDGKLYTRVSDVRVRHVLETIVKLGGPEHILTDAKPHLGTNRLVALCKSFRKQLLDEGCEIHFDAFVKSINYIENGASRSVTGVTLRDGSIIEADRVVFAVGHSARELYRWLAEHEIAMEAKPFALGFRVEHPQSLINDIQYGKWASLDGIPTADYRLKANYGKADKHRAVYSFCMCPGGQIVPSSTQPGGVCINGMSHASRRGYYANSALVVTITPKDFTSFGKLKGLGDYRGVLDGLLFQREAEERAYRLGGCNYYAPAQRLADFHRGVFSSSVGKSTYKPGIEAADLSACYPSWINDFLRKALDEFNRKMPGYLTNDATLLGVETRTSAPLSILRDPQTLQCSNLVNFYPCGEGSGYAGGIVSAAIDGLKIAERILAELSAD